MSWLLHPASLVSLLAVVPILGFARWRLDIMLGTLLWIGFTRWWAHRWFGPARPDGHVPSRSRLLRGQVAGVVAGVGGAVGVTFLRAWDLWLMLALLPFVVLATDSAARRFGPRMWEVLARLPLVTVVAWGAITTAGYQSLATRAELPQVKDDFLYPLRASDAPEPLSDEERANAVAIVRATLRGQSPPDAVGRLAEPFSERAWVTLFRPVTRKRWVRAHGAPGAALATQLEGAAGELRGGARGRALDRAVIQIDLEGPAQRLGARGFRRTLEATIDRFMPGDLPFRFLMYDDEAGVDGFRLVDGEREATVLPADPLLDGWFTPRRKRSRYRMHNWRETKRQLERRSGLQAAEPWADGALLLNFRTYSFAQPDPRSERTVELYRGNTLFEGEVTEEVLLDGISAAAEWLLGTVEDDGRFDYEYFPTRDDHGRGYNEVRHAGSVYGLFHVANLAAHEPTLAPRRDAYVAAGVKALGRVYEQLGPPPGTAPGDGYVAFLEGRGGARSNSGAAALTLLSFLERPAPESVDAPQLAASLVRPGDDAILAGLAKTLMAMVDERGHVFQLWTEAQEGGLVDEQPLYYPGELLLALVRYHERTGDTDALEVAKRVGRAQIAYAERPWQIPDHWVMQALDHLDRLDPDDPTWRQAAYHMGREYVSEQFPPQVAHAPDYRGAYRRDMEIGRTTRAASRGEAIGGVARIAWRRGDPSRSWERSLILGARHLLEQQYDADNTFSFPRPAEAIGAIRMGLIDNHCRIDNNQHAVVALDNALQALRRERR